MQTYFSNDKKRTVQSREGNNGTARQIYDYYNRGEMIFLVLAVLWTQLANGLSGTPHLHVAHSLELLVQTVAIVGL